MRRVRSVTPASDRRSPEPEGAARRRRVIPVAVLIVVVIVLGMAAFGSVSVANTLGAGRRSLEHGRRALLDGRTSDAVAAFEDADAAFRAAVERGAGWPARIGASLPYLGRSIDVLLALGRAGERLAEAGSGLASTLDRLPGGLDALSPTEGAIPMDALVALGPALVAAEDDVAAASGTLRSSPAGFLIGPVADARSEALKASQELEHFVRSARAFADAFPEFAGAGGVRRYLFFAEDPAELRGTGGIWGAYSILTAESGRFRFSPFRPVQSIGTPVEGTVAAPNADYERNYGEYGAPTYWLNANMTPDLPSAAQATMSTWSALGRVPVDGTIAADPFALRELLRVTGAVRVPEPPVRLTSDNVVPLLANRAFARFPDPRQRKAILGEAARAVVDRFLSLDGRVVPRLRALVRAFSDGHLKLYTGEPSMQRALAIAGVDRSLDAGGGDLLSVIVNSGSGGKVDFFVERSLHHSVRLLPDGSVATTTSITIANEAPTSGQPKYVIGPHRPGSEAGDDTPLLAVFCAPTCELRGAERNGSSVEVRTGTELGYRFFRDYFTIPSGAEGNLTVRTSSSDVWSGGTAGGGYRLAVIGQTTIRPTRASIRLSAPPGLRFVEGSGTGGLRVDGSTASWTGVLPDRLDVRVSLERIPLAIRLWRTLRDAL